ncbi:MAG: (4Fe-4S)-binding protein [Syntrophomonadaceae bacterium]|nr:(4Fe-4S)-binding protein [Syntrophomonadaceae bacterium]
MSAIKIASEVYWVGVQDPQLKLFDTIMELTNGTSYNAYLIKGEKHTAVIDTVKATFAGEYLDNLAEVIDLQQIEYLVVQHAEPDHAGSIEMLLDMVPGLTIVTNYTAYTFIKNIVNREFKVKFVAHDDELDLGGKKLRFIGAPLLHWPETFYSCLEAEAILFSSDTFGSHFSDDRLFSDLIGTDFLPDFKYYYDMILGHFKKYLWNALKRINALDLKMICPSHGPIFRDDLDHFIDLYHTWTFKPKTEEKPRIVIAYASAYGYTERIKNAVKTGLESEGQFIVADYDLTRVASAEILAAVNDCAGLLIGSPTINKDAVKSVWDLLGSLSPVDTNGIIASAFGSYGWSGEAVPNIIQRMRMLRMRIMPGLRIQFNPAPEQLEQARQFGIDFAKAVSSADENLEEVLAYQRQVNPLNPFSFNAGNYRRKYENEDIIVYWNPEQCTHDTNCFVSLPKVFAPEKTPWVNVNGDSAESIMKTIDACPSGALKYDIKPGASVPPGLKKGPGWIGYYENK